MSISLSLLKLSNYRFIMQPSYNKSYVKTNLNLLLRVPIDPVIIFAASLA